MSELLYKLRKAKNKLKRNFMVSADEDFADRMEYTTAFKVTMISLFSFIAVALVVIILILTKVINIGETPINIEAVVTSSQQVQATIAPTTTVEPTSTPEPRATLVPGPTPKVLNSGSAPIALTEDDKVVEVGWIDTTFLNVRTGPSEESPRIGVLPQDSVVEVLEKKRWLKIKFLGGAGYCTNSYYVSGFLPADKYDALPTIPPADGLKIDRIVAADYSHVSEDTRIIVDEVIEPGAKFYVAEVWCDPTSIYSLLASDELDRSVRKTTSRLFAQTDAVLAINGDFISYHEEGIAIRNSEVYRDTSGYDMLVLYDDGEMVGVESGKMSASQMLADGALQCWSYGPILVQNYVAIEDFTGKSQVKPPNPRTGIGMVEPGHYIIIVADGRKASSMGPTLAEFAKLFEEYGCKTAYNLEGGSASTIIFKGEVLNEPSGGEQKKIGDIIYFK